MSMQTQARSFITSLFLEFLWFFFSLCFGSSVSFLCKYLTFLRMSACRSVHSFIAFFFFIISKAHVCFLRRYRMNFIVVPHGINVCIIVVGFAQHNTIRYIIKWFAEVGEFDWLRTIQSSACNQHNSQLRTCKIQSHELC